MEKNTHIKVRQPLEVLLGLNVGYLSYFWSSKGNFFINPAILVNLTLNVIKLQFNLTMDNNFCRVLIAGC